MDPLSGTLKKCCGIKGQTIPVCKNSGSYSSPVAKPYAPRTSDSAVTGSRETGTDCVEKVNLLLPLAHPAGGKDRGAAKDDLDQINIVMSAF